MAVMSSVRRCRDISPVALQLVGGAVSSSLYCGEVEGLEGLAESFMVELYRCKVCQFTCGLKASISSHLQARHLEEGGAGGVADDREEAELRRGASPYQDEDEDFLLYNMLDMSPPTCDISSEGGLHVAHTCEVSTLFEEDASMFPLKGGPGLGSGLSGPPEPLATQEQMAQSAHLMTLGLCRTSAAKPRPSIAEDSPGPPQPGSLKQTRTGTGLACPLCPAALPSRRLLGVHVRSHRPAGGFSCVCCSRTADSWEQLQPHWSRCRRKRRRRKRREQKQEEQKQEEEMEEEEEKKKKKKTASGRFICPVCLRSFRSAASRRTHQHTRHGDQPGLAPPPAGLAPPTADGCRSRLIGGAEEKEAELPDSQTRRRPSVTEKKTKKTKTSRSLEAEEEPAFCCSLCHRKFSTKLTLRRHLGTHGGARPFTCPHCSYCSRLKASLLQHLRTHTGEKPFRCPECPYASIDRSSLLRHSRTHSQEKPYSCQHCDYSSIQKKSLDLHARRHHRGEVFPCQQCDYSSPDRQLLLRHAQRHHRELTGERTL